MKTIDPERFKSEAFRKKVKELSTKWAGFYKKIIEHARNSNKGYHVIFYDSLKEDKAFEMKRLYYFIKNQLGDSLNTTRIDDRIACTAKNDQSKKDSFSSIYFFVALYKRKKSEIGFEIYTDEEIKMVDGYIKDTIAYLSSNNIYIPDQTVQKWSKGLNTQ